MPESRCLPTVRPLQSAHSWARRTRSTRLMSAGDQKGRGHSAEIRMELHVNGHVLPLAQLGPDYVVLTDPVDHPRGKPRSPCRSTATKVSGRFGCTKACPPPSGKPESRAANVPTGPRSGDRGSVYGRYTARGYPSRETVPGTFAFSGKRSCHLRLPRFRNRIRLLSRQHTPPARRCNPPRLRVAC